MFCGIDWAENHHDIAVVDDRGHLVAKRRISNDVRGLRLLLKLLAEHGDTAEDPIPVAIETSRGLLVACLRVTGRPVYAINPLAVSRYRERHTVARAKSDHADALVLANILRTDAAAHRPLPADTELVQAIAVLARAGQDATWNRQQVAKAAAIAATRVLSRCAGGLRRDEGRAYQRRRPRDPGRRANSGVSGEADQATAAQVAGQGWSAAQHRHQG
jgi:hypothetical protein